jgi:hypothetical protein
MDTAIFLVVLGLRLGVPILIFRFPLPAVLASLVIDAVDQTVFQTFTDLDLSSYQSYDKALDVYYLSLAYISTMRNWANIDAFGISRFLLYYRLVGVAAFELSGAQHRGILLIFPNTFEYFFIFLEAVALFWWPVRQSRRFWLWSAAFIWVVIKLPQEWWIHVAKLDFTDTVRDHPWFGVAVVVFLLAVAAFCWFWVRPRLRPADHPLAIAAAPLPAGLEKGEVRRLLRAQRGRVLDRLLVEKVVLLSLVSTIFAQILPNVDASPLQITAAVAVLVLVDSAVGLATARAGRGFDAAVPSFLALAGVNLAFVGLLRLLAPGDTRVGGATLFFLFLITLVVSTLDRYAPVHSLRVEEWTTRGKEPGDDGKVRGRRRP